MSSPPSPPTITDPAVAILGAGPGGLMLARLLHLAGVPFVVFEREATPDAQADQGGSLDVHAASGQRAIRAAGLFPRFRELVRYDSPTTIADRAGRVAVSYQPDPSGGEGDRPEVDRRALRRMLLDSIPRESVRWGRKVERVGRNERGEVEVGFEGGEVRSGFRLVVGADGAWSKARGMATSAVPEYSGIFYMTTLVRPGDAVHAAVAALSQRGTYMALGGGKEITAQRNGDDSYTIGVGLRAPESTFASATDPARLREDLVQGHFAGWAPELTDLVAKSDAGFRMWPLYAMPPQSLSWAAVPGVTLLGDAAHVTTPFEGEGVNCALFDSLQLAEQIQKHGLEDIDAAVAEYERLMLPRGADLIRRSAANGELLFADDAPDSWMRLYGQGDAE